MRKNQTNYDEIQNQHLDELIRLSYKQADALAAQEETDDECPVDEQQAWKNYEGFLQKLEQGKTEKKQKRVAIVSRMGFNRALQIAACIILVLGFAAPIAIANVEAVRSKVMELLISIQDDHTELNYIENLKGDFYIPAEWNGLYYPSHITEGFSLTDISGLYCEVAYSNDSGVTLYFSEYQSDDQVSVNSEDAVLSYCDLNGRSAFVIEREKVIIIAWGVEDRFFVIETGLTKEEAIIVAKSVRRIVR